MWATRVITSANVQIYLGAPIPVNSVRHRIPVSIETDVALGAFEYTITHENSSMTFVDVENPGFEYSSARLQEDPSLIRVGNVVRFDLTNPLPIGTHSAGELTFDIDPGWSGAIPVAISGVFVTENGMYGEISTDQATTIGEAQAIVPTSFHAKALPNPMNPTTTIEFALPSAGHVQLEIYDASGRRVKRIINRHLYPGIHSAAWLGEDESGISVGSGVYFFRIESAGETLTNKIVVLR